MKKKSSLLLIVLSFVLLFSVAFPNDSLASPPPTGTNSEQSTAGKPSTGWYTDAKGRKFYYLNRKKITGVQQIADAWYYFDEKGVLVTGKKGWFTFNKKKYYLKTNGRLHTGWLKGTKYTYYLNPKTAALIKGWKTINKKKYYFLPKYGRMAKGWTTVKNVKYYFSPEDGSLLKNTVILDAGKRYLLNDKGTVSGEGLSSLGKYTYYVNKNGTLHKGWKKIGSKWYYFTSGGIMKKNCWITLKGYKYYLKEDGSRAVRTTKINNKYYYFYPNVYKGRPAGSMHTGWLTTTKGTYYFNSKGVRMTGFRKFAKKTVYFNSAGKMQTGWFSVNKIQHYAFSDGKLASGWLTLDEKKYYFSEKGAVSKGWQSISDKKYYFDSSGILQTSKWIDKDHYVGSDGAWIPDYDENNDTDFRWPLSSSWTTVTSYFGNRESPGGIGSTNHKGIDIPAPSGVPIYAVAAGTVVVKLPPAQSGGFGNWIQINHGNSIISEYAHLSSFHSSLRVGERVKKGQTIGYVGSTGNSTGPHLHFGILKNAARVNPLDYVKQP